MTALFLSETENAKTTTSCVVCKKQYDAKEMGWVYQSQHEMYTCSIACYQSEKYNKLLTERTNEIQS